MIEITEAQVKQIVPKASSGAIKLFVGTFNPFADLFGLITEQRVAAYIAQVAHESSAFGRLEENLNYSADGLLKVFPKYFNTGNVTVYARHPEKIANRVYANRMGNGDEASGDGWRYKGRGYIQLTGKDNYKRYATSGYCTGDLMSHPEWLANHPGCQKASMWFWLTNGLNILADRGDIRGITRRINGGFNGLDERLAYWNRAKSVFGI